MFLQVETTHDFDVWHARLDSTTSARVTARLLKLSMGLWGDHKTISKGLVELREHFGAGIRIYVTRQGGRLVVVLAGGDKSSQRADIRYAQYLLTQLEERTAHGNTN